MGPGLPSGMILGLSGFGVFPAPPCEADATRACAIMSRWYCCSFLLISEVRLSWPGLLLLFFIAGISRLVGGPGTDVGAGDMAGETCL